MRTGGRRSRLEGRTADSPIAGIVLTGNGRQTVTCCTRCGRDTNARSGVCSSCYQGCNRPKLDQKLRKGKRLSFHDDDFIRDDESEYNPSIGPRKRYDPYHGESSRDDI